MSARQLLASVRDALFAGQTARITLVVLIVLLVGAAIGWLVWYVSRKTPSGRLRSLAAQRARTEGAVRSTPWAVRLGVPVMLLLALLGGDVYLARPETCAQCHRQGAYHESLAQTAHKDITCVRCHMEPTVSGLARFNVDYARWLITYGTAKTAPEPGPGSVRQSACVRCHRDVRTETIEAGGIRIRHSDILATGASCRDCHNDSSHPGALVEPSVPSMDLCLPCHDGETAAVDCQTCHIRDPGSRPEPGRGYTSLKTAGAPDACYACHDEAPCSSCHGIRMPHPPDWAPVRPNEPGQVVGHARPGFVDRELCWRCHFAEGRPFVPAEESCSCHGLYGRQHGGQAWVAEHGPEATGQRGGTFADCFGCHSQTLCDLCHPASYRERYAPNPSAPLTPGYTQPQEEELE
jgi:hypothetical protein